jgi:cobalamin transport system substrate-binding protein
LRIRAALAVLLALAFCGAAAGGAVAPARRVVSMNPSLTRILVRLGAADALVGVDEYSARQVPAVASLPRVGSLYSPSLEAVVALRPDLVVLVPSLEQRDFRERLGELGVPVLALAPDPVDLAGVLDAIERLGARVGREAEARQRIEAIRRTWRAVQAAARDLPHPRAVLVIQRDPLFVVGRGSFLDEMMSAAGVRNLGARFDEPWPRASLEWLVAAAPEVIVDSDADPEPAAEFWARWPSLPAVAHGRVVAVPAGALTLPGPDLDRSLLALARAVHGDALRVPAAP